MLLEEQDALHMEVCVVACRVAVNHMQRVADVPVGVDGDDEALIDAANPVISNVGCCKVDPYYTKHSDQNNNCL